MIKRFIALTLTLALLISSFVFNISATASNDYTQWRQGDAEWNQAEAWPASQYPQASSHYMSEAGCLVCSVAMLLRHYNVVTESNVNKFNPWICNEALKAAGAFTPAADMYWDGPEKAYPGFVYIDCISYSENQLISLYQQGYACIVKVNGSGGYYHYVAVRSASISGISIMDPGWGRTSLSEFSDKYEIYYYKVTPSCNHHFVGEGVCEYCDYRFPWEETKTTTCAGLYKVTLEGGTYPRPNSPYSDAAKNSTLFPKGAKVSVTYGVKNAYGNTWYYCTYNGVSGFVNSDNLSFDSYFTQQFTCVMTSPAEGAVVPKSAYPVIGTLTSQYYPIKEVKAYLDGSCYATVSNVNAASLELRPTDINYNLDFASLASGKHILRIDAKDTQPSSFVTVLNRTFYTETTTGGHTHSYSSSVTTEPTCTVAGVRTYTCSCGASYTETIPALGHIWGTWRTVREASCTETGLMERNCMRCGAEETQTIVATGHDWSMWATICDASCTADGYLERYCKNCSIVEANTIPALGHNYIDGICTRCGEWDPSYCIAHGTCGENLTWILDNNGVLTISGAGKMEDYNNNRNNVPWYPEKDAVKAVVIKDGVRSIGGNAFSDCSSLTNINLPESVTSVGDCAFYGCTCLTNITIPAGVTNIGRGAFFYCASLAGIWVAEENQNYSSDAYGVLFNKDQTELICCPSGMTGTYTVPQHVTSIESDAFNDCSGMTGIIIPDSVTSIGYDAFSGCSSLTNINLPESVTSIGSSAFWGCTNLTSIVIPNSVTCIKNYTFSSCTGLASVTIPNSVTTIGEGAFYNCISLANISIPKGVTSIGYDAFSDCRSLTNINLPESVTCIESSAFSGCTNLTSIIIPNSVTCIKHYTFSGCTSLASVTIPNSITSIGESAFYNCTSLTTISIPKDVTSIDSNAFKNCTGLKDVYFIGTEEEWNAIKIGNGNDCLTGANIHFVDLHTHSYIAVVTAPTCTVEGYTTYSCSCGERYKADFIDALGHNYVDGICTRCGAKNPDDMPTVPSIEFSDVPANAWYAGAVDYAMENSLMNGVGDKKFDPEGSMTRAMLVTVLWRYEGSPKKGTNTFSDVPNGQWYTEAISWASAEGIVGGVGNGKFDPEGKITREQMATILFRYAQKKGIDTSKRGNLGDFPDANRVSSYAKDAVQWAVGEKIINGSDGKLLPQGNATRAQVATILMRFIENIVNQ